MESEERRPNIFALIYDLYECIGDNTKVGVSVNKDNAPKHGTQYTMLYNGYDINKIRQCTYYTITLSRGDYSCKLFFDDANRLLFAHMDSPSERDPYTRQYISGSYDVMIAQRGYFIYLYDVIQDIAAQEYGSTVADEITNKLREYETITK